jgi:ubiquitin C-terminal hydrolase
MVFAAQDGSAVTPAILAVSFRHGVRHFSSELQRFKANCENALAGMDAVLARLGATVAQFRAAIAEPEGLIAQISRHSDGNPVDLGIAAMIASDGDPLSDRRVISVYESADAYVSRDAPEQWIGYHFPAHSLVPTHYVIRSAHAEPNQAHPRSWVIIGETDGGEVALLDRREDCAELNGRCILKKFALQSVIPIVRIAIRQIAPNWLGTDSLMIGYFDVIGKLMDAPVVSPGPVPPAGIANLGCTCYMNAAIQALLRVTPLTDYVLSDAFMQDLNPDSPLGTGGVVAIAYRELIGALSCASGTVSAADLKTAVGAQNALFADFLQHDAHDFLVTLLDALHEDLNTSPRAMGDPRDVFAMSGMKLHAFCNQSRICDLFHGQSWTGIRYTCGHEDYVDEPLVFWSLPLPRADGQLTLHNCIELWQSAEPMVADNGMYCDSCEKVEDVVRQVMVWRFAPVLVIHLKRFELSEGQLQKSTIPVHYPLEFNPRRYARCPEQSPATYDLIAVVCHLGTLDSGHYWCILRDRFVMDVWYSVSDADVRQIDVSDVEQDEAYALFYQQRG